MIKNHAGTGLLARIYIIIGLFFLIPLSVWGSIHKIEKKAVRVGSKTTAYPTVYIDKSVDWNAGLEIPEKKGVYHLLTHGRSGELFIEGEWKTPKQIADFLLSKILNSEFIIQNLNIYGCEFAKGNKGKQAVAYLERQLGVKIAASTNITGIGGDYLLEVGNHDVANIFIGFQGNLQCDCPAGATTVTSGTYTTLPANNVCIPAGENVTFSPSVPVNETIEIHNCGTFTMSAPGGVSEIVLTGGNGSVTNFSNMQVTNLATVIESGAEFNNMNAQSGCESISVLEGGVYNRTGIFNGTSYYLFNQGTADLTFSDDSGGFAFQATSAYLVTDPSATTTFSRTSGTTSVGNGWTSSYTTFDQDAASFPNISDDFENDYDYNACGVTSPLIYGDEVCDDGIDNNWNGQVDEACTDTDGDGIGDLIDIDDDNDGVLDVDEMVANEYINSECENNLIERIGYTSSFTLNDQLAEDIGLIVGTDNTFTTGFPMGNTCSEISFGNSTATFNTYIYFKFVNPYDTDQTVPLNYITLTSDCAGGNEIVEYDAYDIDGNFLYNQSLTSPSYGANYCVTIQPPEDVNVYSIRVRQSLSAAILSGISLKGVSSVQDIDTDNDGIPNRLDLDSDGDGCSDSYEAGAIATENSDNQFTGTDTNGDGLVDEVDADNDGVPDYSSTYNEYALSDNLNLCADTDGDGIGDLVDIDDDNDGVLDATESPDCFFQSFDFISGNRGEHITVTTGLNMSATYQNPEELVDGINSTATAGYAVQFVNGQSNTGANIYTFEFVTPVEVINIYLRYVSGSSHFSSGAVAQLRGSNDGETWIDLNAGVTYSANNQNGSIGPVPGTMRYNQFEVTQNQGRYKYYQIYGVSGSISSNGTSNEVYFQLPSDFSASSYPKGDCTSDTDSDGVYNHHDPDSDGDGCSDSFEAGAIATENPDNQFTGTDTNGDGLVDEVDADQDGLPDYQYQPYAYNDSLNICADTDGDGIGDLVDIDDDNDGVPDSMETTNDCEYVGAEDLSTYTFNNVASVNADFDENNNLTLNRINGSWVSTYSYQTVSAPLYLEFTVDDINSNSMVGIIEENANISPNNYTDQSHKFNFSTNDDYNIRDFGSAALNADTYLPGDVFSIEVDEAGNLSMKKNGAEVYTDVVTGTNFRLVFSTASATAKIYSNMVFGNINEMVYACEDMDTDGDGTPNRLDLDSDGDGCSDSFEAGAIATENPDNQFTGEMGTNGLVDSLETTADSGEINYTSTYSQYAVSDNLNLCADTDGDGVGDLADIDDDNDGVLDATESPDCFYTEDEAQTIVSVTSGLTLEATTRPLTNAYDGDDSASSYTGFQPNQNGVGLSIYEITPTVPVAVSSIDFSMYNLAFTNGTANTVKLQGYDGNSWVDLSPASNKTTTNGTETFTNTLQPNTVFQKYRITGEAGVVYYARVQEIYLNLSDYAPSENPKPDCTSDTDDDGVYNHHDLDSDGDGCSDSYEAGAIATETADFTFGSDITDTNSDGLHEADGIDTDVDGIPDYEYLPYAYSANLNLCADTDGDGVGDLVDIDDDNDGVLDATESPDCFYMEAEVAFVGASSTLTNYNTGSAYSFEELFDGVTNDLATYGVLNTAIAGETIYELEMAFPVELSSIDVIFNYSIFRTTAVFKWQGFNGTSWVDVTGDLSETETTNNTYSYVFNQTGDRYSRYRLLGVSGETYYNRVYEIVPHTSNYVPSLYPKAECAADLDGDEVYNHLDPDTDGDGCSDSFEAGAIATENPDNQFTGEVGTNGLVDSLETTADSGEINYTSTYKFYAQNANLDLCGDTDGDGIGDLIDLDDDNDGILDVEEGACPDGRTPQSAFTNLSQIRNVPSGRYYFDLGNGAFQGDVDNSEDGGWLLVLQYVHEGGTNPNLAVLAPGTDFPVTSDAVLGTDESTVTENWGHAGNAALNQFPEDFEIRFYGESSQNPRIIHFKTTLGTSYVKTGTGTFDNIELTANHTLLTGHTANLPNSAQQEFINQNDQALTNFPFYLNATYHWGISGQGSRWEVDAPQTGSANNTIHRVWVRATTTSVCEPADTDQDGIPNHLDLDSDGDGCPDATEGDAGFTPADLETSSMDGGNTGGTYNGYADPVSDNLGNDVDANGVPIVVAPDGQGAGASQEQATDTDEDGIGDDCDCFDNTQPDTDNDGVPDYADTDADNDGIANINENTTGLDPYTDTDADDVPLYLDDDDNNEFVGNADGLPQPGFDTDADGVANHLDSDSDNDGIPDTVEATGDESIAVCTYADGDVIDTVSGCETGESAGGLVTPIDTDTDGTPDYLDLDSDEDGCPDGLEGGQDETNVNTTDYTQVTAADIDANGMVTAVGCASPTTGDWTDDTVNDGCCEIDETTLVATPTAPTTCNPANDGYITISGGNLFPNTDYEVSYQDGNGVVGPMIIPTETNGNLIIAGLTPGDYTQITITSTGYPAICEAVITTTVTVPEFANPMTVDTDVTDVNCFGESNGAILLTVNGGSGNYSYSWTTTNGGGIVFGAEDQTALQAGDYTVAVTDTQTQCTITVENVTVAQPTAVVSGTVTQTNAQCFGEANGAIDLTPAGGTPPYSYSWTTFDGNIPTGQEAVEDPSGLTVGTYTVVITDANGCTNPNQINVTLTQPNELTLAEVQSSHQNIVCGNGDIGAFAVTAGGGSGTGYEYSLDQTNWTNTTGVFENLSPGTYNVWVRDSNGCITGPLQIVIDLFCVEAVKTQTLNDVDGSGGVSPGDIITYTIAIENTGTTAVGYNMTVDHFMDLQGRTLQFDSGPTFTGADQGSGQGTILAGETATYTATYTWTQADVDAGGLSNQAEFIIVPPTGTNFSELSDDDGGAVDTNDDGDPDNDPTVYPVGQITEIRLVKTANFNDGDNDGCTDAGETITYTFTVTNPGSVTLDNVDISDPLLANITFISGDDNSDDELDVSETWTYTGTYTITQDNIDTGTISNQATVTAITPDGTSVSDLSGATTDDNLPTETTLCRESDLSLIKTANFNDENGDGCTDAGETISYTLTLANTGNVSLNNVDVTDDLLDTVTLDSGDTDSDTVLDVSETWTYTGSYTITQDDIDTGTINNQATATALAPSGTSVSDLSGATTADDLPTETALCQESGLSLVKTANFNDENGDGCTDVGETIGYTLTLTNTGNLSLSSVNVNDPILALTLGSGDTDSDTELDVSETWTYTGSYTITQDDIDTGTISNQATATALAPDGTSVSDLSGATAADDLPTETTLCQESSLALVKTADFNDENGDGCTDVGETIGYTLTLTNTGNLSLDNVNVSDPILALTLGGGDTDSDTVLDVNETWTYTGTYTITQDDIDAGTVSNQATATATAPDGTSVSDLSGTTEADDLPTETALCQEIDMGLVKTGTPNDENGDGCDNAGETITYAFTLTNTGNVSLSNVNLTDNLLLETVAFDSGDLDGDTNLDVDETWTYTGSYTIAQEDLDAGTVSNQATATASAPNGTSVSDLSGATDADDLPTETTLCEDPAMELIKEASVSDPDNSEDISVGDVITYTFTLTNTGNVTISGLTYTDNLTDADGGVLELTTGITFISSSGGSDGTEIAPGEVITYRATYQIEQGAVDAGGVSNTATVNGTTLQGTDVSDVSDDGDPTDTDEDGDPDNDPTVTPIARTAGLTLVKTASEVTDLDDNGQDEGDRITYTFRIENTGNVTLDNLVLTDPLFPTGTNLTLDETTLIPGQVSNFSVDYLLTATDIGNERVVNSATITGTDPENDPVDDVSDDGDPADSDLDPDTDGDNDPTIVDLDIPASLSLIKTATLNDENGDGLAQEGETITYSFTVTNTGNIGIIGLVIDDPTLFTPAEAVIPSELAPGEEGTITDFVYIITQLDVDAGSTSNTATVTGQRDDITGDDVTDISDDGNPTNGNNNPTVTPLPNEATVTLLKEGTYSDSNGDGMANAGDEIIYNFTVTNTGNVTLDNLVLTDNFLPVELDLTLSPTSIAPGETATAQVVYPITQADMDAGQVSNRALVTGDDPNGNEVTADSDNGEGTGATIVPLPKEPSLNLIKTSEVADTNSSGRNDAGDVVTYTFTVTNTGNVTVDMLTITDPRILVSNLPVTPSTLEPGETGTATATYTVTQLDMNRESITNTATVNGEDPDGNPVSDDSDNGTGTGDTPTITPLTAEPGIEVLKTQTVVDTNGDEVTGNVGDVISYTITVTNPGNVTLRTVTLTDTFTDMDGGILSLDSGPTFDAGNSDNIQGILRPGQQAVYTASYTITQAVVDAGGVSNTVEVEGTTETEVVADNDTIDYPIAENPILEVIKTASISDEDNDGATNAGDIITYTILVENTGNVTLTGVGLTDTLTDMDGASLTLDSGPTFVNATDGSAEGTLNPSETATYTATYTLTQSDINAGGVSNTVTVTATSPEGTPVEDISDDGDPANGDDTPTEILIEKAPELTLIKTVSNVADTDGSGDNNAGDVVTYTFSIENTGNVTIADLVLTDDFLPTTTNLTVTPSTLDPGEEAVVSADYVLTQDDIDLGEIINSAIISGTDPDTETVTDVSDDGDPTDSGLDPDTDGDNDPTYLNLTTEASLYFDKVATVNDPNNNGQADAGETITYDFTVKNNGNITIENITFDDPNLGLTDAPITPSTLGPDQTGTGAQVQYTITQADIDAGFVVNDAIASGDRADGNGSVSDDSDDGNPLNGGNNPTRTDFDQNSSITLLKSGTYTDTNGDGVANVGDHIIYDFTVTNTGNTTISGVSVVDARISLASPGQNTTPNTLAPGEEGSLSITYPITQSDLNRRLVANTATAEGTSPKGTTVTATSNIVVVLLPKQPSLEHIKTSQLIDTNGNGVDDVGDQIEYTFTVTNTGNVTITVLSIDDPAIGVSNLGLVPSTLDPGEQGSATAVYDITQADVDAGEVVNSALVSGNDPDGETVDDPSDNGGGGDDPTVTPITAEPSYTVVKTQTVANTNADTVTGGVGDQITYTIAVENTGNVTLTDITLTTDTFQDLLGNTLSLDSGPSFVSADQSSPEGTLIPSEIATYTATYTIAQAAVDGDGLSNQTTFTANPPSGTALTVISDDGDTTNGNEDPTLFPIEEIPVLEVIKKALPITDTDNSGTTTAGDVLTFQITVTNAGNVTLNTLALTDTFTDADGNELTLDSGPTFISSDAGSAEGTLVPGETATYDAVYTLQQDDINSGGVSNTVTATALSPGGTSVEDISDDGNPLNGNDTPTEVDFELEPSLSLIKVSEVIDTNNNDVNDADDTIAYTFTVTNTGNVTVDNLTLNDPRLSATPVLTPTILEPGQAATATFSYDIQQGDINNGRVVNRAVVTGTDPDGETVRDLSDDGSEFDSNNDGNPNNDPTITDLLTVAKLELVKTAAYDPVDGRADVGETITYTFTLTNTGYVTVEDLTITDPLLGIDSPETITLSTPLDPGDTEILTISNATYTITQEDIDNGSVSNTATINGLYVANDEAVTDISDEGDPTTGPDNPTVTPLPKAAEITLDKTGDFNDENTDGFADAGETVDYNFTITNTGNVTIDNLSLMDDFLPNGADVTLSLTTLPPGEVALAAATYTLTQTDVDNGEIINIAETTGTDPDGVETNAIDTVTVTLVQNPSLELIKTASDPNADTNNSGRVDAGDQIVYTFDVTNTGNVTVNTLTISDPRLPVNNLGVNPQTLAPGESGTVTYTYTITQADMDAGSITNTATVNGFAPSNEPVSDISDNGTGDGDDPTVTPIIGDPSYTVVKTQTVANINIDGVKGGIGDRITYTITVENTGNVTLTDITITDDIFQDLKGNTLRLDSGPTFVSADQSSPEGTLLPDEIATYTAAYTITQAAVDGGGLSNQAIFTANPPSGATITVISDDGDTTNGNENPTVFPIEETPSIEVLKLAEVDDTDASGSITAGDVITYGITVENTGNVTVNNLNLTDTFTNGSGATLTPGFDRNSGASPESTLAPGETATYSVTYTLTQDDIDVGGVSNTVTATATSSGGVPVEDVSDDGNPADSDGDGNPGNDPTETLVTENPSIETVKILTPITDPVAGTTVEFTINVTNTGNVTLSNINLEDVLVDARGNMLTLTTGPDFQSADEGSLEGILQVGETAIYAATYVLAQSDVDAGGISNGVIAKGNSVQGTEVMDKSDDGDDTDGNTTNDNTNLFIEENPGIEITKPEPTIVQNDGNTTIDAGDVLDYTITVTNTGNVTLRNLVVTDTISDFNDTVLTPDPIPVFESSDNNNEGTLLPNETAIYRALYTITQNDVDAGGLRNHAFVTSLSPNNIDIADISDDGIDDDGNTEDDPTETEILAAPSIALIKTGVTNDEDGDGCDNVGETITYTFTVTNTGNVSLSSVDLTDSLLGSTLLENGDTDNDMELDVTETWIYTGTYTITQDNIDDGLVSNQATVTATAPDGTSVNDLSGTANDNDDISETALCQETGMALVKTAVFNDLDGDGCSDAGETITYAFTLTNTGNITLNSVGITDALLPTVTLVGGDTDGDNALDVGETWTYTGDYTITQGDINTGSVSNGATAVAEDPNGVPVSDLSGTDETNDDETITALCQGENMVLEKEGVFNDENGDTFAQQGETVTYTFTVINSGNITIDNLTLTDGFLPAGTDLTLSSTIIAPEETATATAIYTLTETDMENGEIINTAEVSGTEPDGMEVSTTATDTVVLASGEASLKVIKTAITTDNGDGVASAGDIIDYTITVTNTGETVIDDIELTDVLTNGSGNELTLTVEPTFESASNGSSEGHLEVGETATYLASYTLVRGDVDTGSLSNQVTADGTDIYGRAVSDLSGTDETNNDPTIVDFDTMASINLIKTAVFNDENGNGYTDVGETISYSFSVTNTGNVDLFDVTITEDLAGVDLEGAAIPVLQVGETDSTTYSGEYTLTEADMEKGSIDNQAEAVGEDMQGNRAHDYSDDPNNPTDNDIDGDGDPDDSTDIIIIPDEEDCEIVVYDIISPNGDGIDDVLRIDGIDCYPDNTLEIYNRWGIRVFSTENYGAGGETFQGYSDGRATIQRNQKLPTGTYYYILNYIDDNGTAFSKAGPIYIITD